MITVGGLIKQLEKFPAELEVIIQPDDEGNNMHKACGAEDGLVETLRHYYVDSVDDEEYGEPVVFIW